MLFVDTVIEVLSELYLSALKSVVGLDCASVSDKVATKYVERLA